MSQRLSESAAGTPHLQYLDGVRGLAILVVLLRHFLPDNDVFWSKSALSYSRLLTGSWMGVDLFFVLSGFLITGILLRTKTSTNFFSVFYLRRALRIFPLYYGILMVVFVLIPLLGLQSLDGYSEIKRVQGFLWLYAQNIPLSFQTIQADPYSVGYFRFSHFWSLAVEEQFYLLWPLIVWMTNRKQFIAVCGCCVALAILLRLIMYYFGVHFGVTYTFTLCRIDSLAMGGFVAVMASESERGALKILHHRMKPIAILAGIAILFVWAKEKGVWAEMTEMRTWGYTASAILSSFLIVSLLNARPDSLVRRVFSMRWLRFFGTYSYGLYVLHFPLVAFYPLFRIPSIADAHFPGAPLVDIWIRTIVLMALCLFTAMISYHCYEKPLLTLKRFFVARPRINVQRETPLPVVESV